MARIARGRRIDLGLEAGTERLFAGLIALFLAVFLLDAALPPPLERARAASPVVLDQEGQWLRAFTTAEGRWRLAARLNEVDPAFVERLVAIEDARFRLHPGVDPIALARAGLAFARSGRITQGGSTITMQLARLIEPRPRNIGSKLVEILRAIQIERRLSKDQILEAYLTMAPYGGNLEGVRAASRAYFRRDPVGLSDAEIALLVALPQAPEARRPDRQPEAARASRNAILDRFAALGAISPQLAAEGKAEAVPARTPFPVIAPQFAASAVAAASGATVVRSHIDRPLQQSLQALVDQHLTGLDDKISAAVLVVEIAGRRVRAHVGGGAGRAGEYLDLTGAIRSPGSTLKPFVYALAMDDGFAAPSTLVEDMPRRFAGYLPENFDRRFRGEVRLAEALQHSLNLPAVAALERVGAARFEGALKAAGAQVLLPKSPESEAGLALALGGVGMTLKDLVMLYAGLGDGGWMRPLMVADAAGQIAQGPPAGLFGGYRFTRPDTAEKLLGVLAATPTPTGRAPAALAQGAPTIAFKTGTSYGFRDAWAIGVGQGYAIGVWLGRPDGAPRPGAMGRTEALPLLFEAFDRVAPVGQTPMQAWQRERASPGQDRMQTAASADTPQILFPPDGADVLKPQGEDAARGFALAAQGGRAPLTWYVEGTPLPTEPTSGRVIWRPDQAGFYEVAVVDADGRRAQSRVRVRAGF
jgi:penicillin-binding protein 1C